MTTRERKERRIEQRGEWADRRRAESDAAFQRARDIGDSIPLGQPILVGHHSEKHHRAEIARMDGAMRRGVENSRMVEHHAERAEGIQHQLDTSIYSDDPDALEALDAKIAGLEAQRDRMKAINKEIRKGAGWNDRLTLSDDEKTDLETSAKYSGTVGYPAYALTNIGATIRTAQKRKADISARHEISRLATEAGGMIIKRIPDQNWCRVAFAKKPSREILDALRAADYSWGGGLWCGYLDQLPAIVAEAETV